MNTLKELLGIEPSVNGKVRIQCPLHDDRNPSADIDFANNVFYCWGCNKKLTLEDLCNELLEGSDYNELEDNDSEIVELFSTKHSFITESDLLEQVFLFQSNSKRVNWVLSRPVDPIFFEKQLEDFIIKRKITHETYSLLHKIEVVTDYKSRFYGYIKFYLNEFDFTARCFIKYFEMLGKPKYLNNTLHSKSFYNIENTLESDRILVEGIFDYLTLRQLGFDNVIMSLGANIKDDLLFQLKKYDNYTFLLLDNDLAGVKASKKILEFANKNDIPVINLELPYKLLQSNDVNECLENGKEEKLSAWLKEQFINFSSNDIAYVESLVNGDQPELKCYSTGLINMDELLAGGYKQGLHAISAIPGAGKTAFVCYLANHFAKNDINVLYLTYEVSRRQIWSRLFSIYSMYTWVELEQKPSIIEQSIKQDVLHIASRLRVISNAEIGKALKIGLNYDVFIIDFFQAMPLSVEDNELISLDINLTKLLDFVNEYEKVGILICSLAKDNYKNPILSFKGSSNIEYRVETGMLLDKIGDNKIKFNIKKNRRGASPKEITMLADLGHCLFNDSFSELE